MNLVAQASRLRVHRASRSVLVALVHRPKVQPIFTVADSHDVLAERFDVRDGKLLPFRFTRTANRHPWLDKVHF